MVRHNISQRDAFWNRVYGLAKSDRKVVIICADIGAPSLDKFRRDLPSQFVNVGIAESNATLLATGLSLTGKKVFTYAIAPFITLRCLEQIRVGSGLMKTPMTIVGVGAGFGYAEAGPTHQLIEDIAIMRSMPNVTIHNITDSAMAFAFAEISYRAKKTSYIRLEREVLADIYDGDSDFSKGLSVFGEKREFYIISTGNMTHLALEVAEKVKKKISVGVVDVFTYPINERAFIDAVKGAKKLVTLEEHFLCGGLGSAVCEILNDHGVVIPVERIGLSQEKGYCYVYGGRDLIRRYYGIDKKNIEIKIKEFLEK